MSRMVERLIVSLGEAHEATLWCWGNIADKQCLKQGECQPGERLPEEIAKTPAIVLVPGQRVVIRTLKFEGSSRLVKAQRLAWQFEEELLQEVDALNWVILAKSGPDYTLAGYDPAEMARWQATIASLGIKPLALIPDVLATPFSGQPVVYKLRQSMLHRRGSVAGYCVQGDWPLELLVTGPEPAPFLSNLPEHELLWQCAAEKALLRINLEQRSLKKKVLQQLSKINALQAVWIGVTMLMMSLATGALDYQRQREQFKQQALVAYSKLFPDEAKPTMPVERVKERMVALEEKLQQPQFFAFGEQLNQVMTEAQRKEIQSLHFDADAGKLILTLRNLAGGSSITVNENGYRIQQEKEADGQGGTITIREDAS